MIYVGNRKQVGIEQPDAMMRNRFTQSAISKNDKNRPNYPLPGG